MTNEKTVVNGRFNVNTLVMTVCTAILLAVIGWVGRTSGDTHDRVINLEAHQAEMSVKIGEMRTIMITRTDLSVELLKLQIPAEEINKKVLKP